VFPDFNVLAFGISGVMVVVNHQGLLAQPDFRSEYFSQLHTVAMNDLLLAVIDLPVGNGIGSDRYLCVNHHIQKATQQAKKKTHSHN
jgi:hypothetical protein